ncbi:MULTISPECIES: Cd(II)/Pb(II)-responsive transcriptional regulator [Acinetobacter]|uniref:Cd(II)/Pb(II)-responsive transcriptional regulator n=1 Tax=Acinetobacter TaxID=469 RepID=UPI0013C30205|nr:MULTISPECIES: Cd(II)/Pb(II)-responsive transcriptional regulator [Acinetobacter]MDO7332532.1 Cd(II)/Pb(II)-responsive transcriptional regulator [Acinetobacter baumannii]MBN6538804.1 Cd(II)/Pb(II)-responsive transcriptional regulator [Acinetobacter pittii]MDE3321092.1 Cd(II)/Pb(II)-responsive transcriptional regulator [Acinetobacter nosocomialis]MDV7389456.1 Cd(II)/Pb(II)-responsive transcriptional regulator [Acinetobacter baumannii]MDV7417679.1 Cd(II)/Pb(II)-responsive transcriptional regul
MNFKIGELAAKAGCQIETIRYYERRGLLDAPTRSAGNYRLYGAAHAERLTFIRRCRSLDMSLDEVQKLLTFQNDPEQPCCGVNDLLDQHIGEIQRKMVELQALKDGLVRLRSRCQSNVLVKECEILRDLVTSNAKGS